MGLTQAFRKLNSLKISEWSFIMRNKFLTFLAQISFIVFLLIILAGMYIISFHTLHPETVYYFGIGAIIISAIILSVAFYGLANKLNAIFKAVHLDSRDFFPCLLVAVFIMYSFHITIPTLADRSISIYLLSQLANHNGKASVTQLQNEFLSGYVGNYSVVCRRMWEQIETGNVVHEGMSYSLTPQGARTIKFLRFFSDLTGVNPYYVESSDPHLLPYRYTVTDEGCQATP